MDIKMKRRIITLVVFAGMLLNFNNSSATWKNTIGLSNYYDENPYHYNSAVPLNFSSTTINSEYVSDSSGLSIGYSGAYSLVPQLSNTQLTDNSLNLTIPYYYGDFNNFSVSASYGLKYNSGDYGIYNNNQFGVTSLINQYISETSILRAGYKGTYKNYYNNTDFSFTEHMLFVGYKTYFETFTSINAELDYGYKNLSNNLINLGGIGKGKSSSDNSQSLGQIVANIKIGQSLAEKTGLSLLYSQSWNTSLSYTSMMNTNPDLIFEKEIYDDPYSFESRDLSITLTQYLPWNLKIQGYGFYSNKNYEYSFDFSNDLSLDKRKDYSKGAGINIEMSFNDTILIFKNSKLILNYLYLANTSNSDVFNYRSNAVNIGVKLGF